MKNRIIAHRGLWSELGDQNSPSSIKAAVSRGYGFETDIRDRLGKLVISHDPSQSEAASLESICELITKTESRVALNVKADGLAPLLQDLWSGDIPKNVVFFDMSWPQTLSYIHGGMTVALRASEWEHPQKHVFKELGIKPRIWLDGFVSDWWIGDPIIESLGREGEIYLVSPEIHGREPHLAWDWARKMIDEGGDVYVCTDEWDKMEEALCQ